ncbi:MAG TPA: hypothetical protein VKK79_24020, partial [Candidatus Lokiarchaeia archaeon]|nr:hypothetical protein [Candidatus Lokiarchaeia archaeon]
VTGDGNKNISRIDQEGSFILLEHGTLGIPITYALVVGEDLLSLRYFLTMVKSQFEGYYKTILPNLANLNLGQQLRTLFLSFDRIVNNMVSR